MPTAKTLIGYLPLAIFVGVMCWRMRTMDKARPLRLWALWLVPVLFVILVSAILLSTPPGTLGFGALVVGASIGVGIGWQRSRMMRLHLEGQGSNARVMVRQSRGALLLLMALAGVRAIARSATGTPPMGGTVHAAHLSAAPLVLTDGLLGLALGMIVAQRIGLWRRARALRFGADAKLDASMD